MIKEVIWEQRKREVSHYLEVSANGLFFEREVGPPTKTTFVIST